MFCFINMLRSHLTQVRGLKYHQFHISKLILTVAPHAGAWIEMKNSFQASCFYPVAPHAGAWIEIDS